MLWKPGSGEQRAIDHLRTTQASQAEDQTNQYFVHLYQSFAEQGTGLEAREHTAQVAADEREIREQRFRSGELDILFCSPTMELGVDISQLNVVNMRNVPPTPANYAQRSGRAGRSGQPALVTRTVRDTARTISTTSNSPNAWWPELSPHRESICTIRTCYGRTFMPSGWRNPA